ncbi:11112_t:CDS:2 [Entrophospora sp. SA101]|nr:11112_t:CDS:2 [Entrophospora sp. SA101]
MTETGKQRENYFTDRRLKIVTGAMACQLDNWKNILLNLTPNPTC